MIMFRLFITRRKCPKSTITFFITNRTTLKIIYCICHIIPKFFPDSRPDNSDVLVVINITHFNNLLFILVSTYETYLSIWC
ncbi:hypothetical protein PBCV1_a259aR [Paramecium bursaria Chlorella virus 1]|uniref:Uncharacterized protein n=1 Tax=Paramecium bursaria Chlorella virus 1 TaxID=10506 RepID=Q84576_PBCV1|nr:hypothetical protein PBCV1_a259aR [Paramecium bursaria Chlorella virus 1]AAC96627.2 hypothetical protein [Paramecium bursaria Chlorella virus 1]